VELIILACLYYLGVRIFDRKGSRKALDRLEGVTHGKRQRKYEQKNRAGKYDAGRTKRSHRRAIDLDEAIGAWEDAG
jgi:hypothetical protein